MYAVCAADSYAKNIASVRTFVKAGYRLAEEFELNQARCYAYERPCPA